MSRSERVAAQTEIRRRMFENGYTPLANKNKMCVLSGWPTLDVDLGVIEGWSDMLGYLATGVRIDGRLVAVDFDIDDDTMLDSVWRRLDSEIQEKLNAAPTRFGGGAKIALFVRLADGEDVFGRMVSQAYAAPGDDDTQRVEIFASGAPRQFGVYGPRSHDDEGNVATEYRWADGQGLCEVAVDALPAVTVEELKAVCDAASMAMREAGWVYEVKTASGIVDNRVAFDLNDDMLFDTLEHGEGLSLADLEAVCDYGGEGVRLSAGWLEGAAAVNRKRCIARLNIGDDRVQIWETANCKLHRPADLDVQRTVRALGERLREVTGKDGDGDGDCDGDGEGLSRWEQMQARAARGETMFSGPSDEGGGDGDLEGVEDTRPVLDLTPGKLAVATLIATDALVACGYVYRMGGRLVGVTDGRVFEMTEPRLALEIGALFRCVRVERRGKKVNVLDVDPSMGLVRQVLSLTDQAGYRDLRGVVDMPLLQHDGTLLADGYDAGTQLVVRDDMGVEGLVPADVGAEDARAALEALWRAFDLFPYVGEFDRGGALACALTAVARPWLPTAPMFAFDAPAPGSGKSLLCRALGAVAGHCEMAAPLPLRNEDEVRKRMLSMLLAAPRAVVYDNQIGMLDSASMASVLTSETFSDRELGHSRTLRPSTNVLIMVNGNNMALGGDMPRRAVRVRIDPQTETPFARVFDFDPETRVRQERREIVAAALTLLKWGMGTAGSGRIGSFERWDEVVGQTVARVGADLDTRFGDPADNIMNAHAEDPRRDDLGDLLLALRAEFGNKWFTAAEVAGRMAGASATNPLVEAFGYDKPPNSKAVGRHLSYRRDARMFGMVAQVSRDAKTKVSKFRIWSDDDQENVVVDGELEQRRAEQRSALTALGAR